MRDVSIGVHVIMKDESDWLTQCLESVKDADEMIIVDTGSRDSSVRIAETLGAKVFQMEWSDDFSFPRNEALKHASTDWILYLDADECLLTDLNTIRNLIRSENAEAFTVLFENVLGSNLEDCLIHHAVRIFRNHQGYQFRGKIHEEIESSIIQKHGEGSIYPSTIRIRHYGYLQGVIHKKSKIERNERILKRALDEKPNDPFYLYNLGITYCQMDRLVEAKHYMQQALEVTLTNAPYRSTLVKDVSKILLELGEVKQVESFLQTELERYPDYPDLHDLLGQTYEMQGKFELSYEAYQKATKGTDSSYVTEAGMGSYRSLSKMGEIAEKLGFHDDAARSFHRALNYHPHFIPALKGIALAFQALDVKDDEIANFLLQIVKPGTTSEYLLIVDVLDLIGAYNQIIEVIQADFLSDVSDSRLIIFYCSSLIQIGQWIEVNRILNLAISQLENSVPDELFLIWAICQWLLFEELQADFLIQVPLRLRERFICIDHLLQMESAQTNQDHAQDCSALIQELLLLTVSLNQLPLGDQITTIFPDTKLFYAKTLYRNGYTMVAAELLISLLEMHVIDDEGLFYIGEILFDKGQYLHAAGFFEQLLQEHSEQENTKTAAALCYLRLAESNLVESIHLAPDVALFKEDLQNIRSCILLLEKTSWHTAWTGNKRRIRDAEPHHLTVHDRKK